MIATKGVLQKITSNCFALFLYLYLNLTVGCTHKNDIKISTTNQAIMNIDKKLEQGTLTYEDAIMNIDKKLEQGTLTYEDVFETNYGEYNEKTPETSKTLDNLVKKLKSYNTRNSNKKSNIDNIISNNLQTLVNRLIDSGNLKYGIYGSNSLQWFAGDKTLKAPLNYFQQQFVILASDEILEKISREIVKTIIQTEKNYTINFGILWTVYNNKYNLNTCFGEIISYIASCENKVYSKKQPLSMQEKRVLKEILEMEKFNDIITTDFIEYVAKTKIVAKGKDMLTRAKKVLKTDAKKERNKNKAVKVA